jgi:cytochrome c oxidase cbb3-type subunit 4
MTLVEMSGLARTLWPVWLILVFAVIALWAFWPANRKRFDEDARIPLNDDAES